jgi:hypothetical protein
MIIFKSNRTRSSSSDTFPGKFEEGITYIQVLDTNRALAFMGANYFGNPSENWLVSLEQTGKLR